MQFMIIEHFRPGKVKDIYRRFDEKGRMLPDGVQYISSWMNEEVTLCYQLMEAEDVAGIRQWIANWDDLVDFEVIPVISSAEAKQKVFASP